MSLNPLPPDALATSLGKPFDPMRYEHLNLDEREVHGMLSARIQPSTKVLDVGCGVGQLAEHLSQTMKCIVTGVEPQPERAAVARLKGITVIEDYFCPSTAENLTDFDYVLFADALEHFSDPVSTVALAKSCLKPKGSIVISVPNVAHWTIRLNLLRGRFDYEQSGLMDATHLRWFTHKSLHNVLESAGLVVIYSEVTCGTWLPCYKRRPFRSFGRGRKMLIHKLCDRFPYLFGCQHIIEAVIEDD